MAVFKKIIFFAAILVFCGCFLQPHLYKRTEVVMGTFVEVSAPSLQAVNFAFSFMKKLAQKLDSYSPASDIYRINKNAGWKPVKVSPYTIEVLSLSRRLYELSGGRFDVSAGRIIRFWKRIMRKEKLKHFPSLEEVKRIASYKGMDKVEVDAAASKVFIKDKNITLDLGGIAKGYIVDKTIEALKKKGVRSVLINAGGDIYCLGNNPEDMKPWRVGVRNPSHPRRIVGVVPLSDAAIATSGDSEQFFTCCSKIYAHIIDLKNGLPVEKKQFMSVSVIAPNLTTADGLATLFFILGKDKIPAFLASHHSNLKVLVAEGGDKGVHIYQYGGN